MTRRRKTPTVKVGQILLGSRHPIAIQSMTDTPTTDVRASVKQTLELIQAGSDMVRLTINNDKAAKSIVEIIERIRQKGYTTPIIGDFHYQGHLLLRQHKKCARLLDKYRINPGNVGKGKQHDTNFADIIKIAIENNKPVRIGVNGGSLDEGLLTELMTQNSRRKTKKSFREITHAAMIQSALRNAHTAEKLGLKKNKIVLSIKTSNLQDLVRVNTLLAQKCDYVLHLGLTEAGSDVEGISASAAALAILLQRGIGDTIRVSLTPQPGVSRAREVEVCQSILQAMGLRYFSPNVVSCPGCGRTDRHNFQKLAQSIKVHIKKKLPQWQRRFPGIEQLTIAVMGCVVNGPGESRHADIGISYPGRSETPVAGVYAKGKRIATLKGKNIKDQFIAILEDFIRKNYR